MGIGFDESQEIVLDALIAHRCILNFNVENTFAVHQVQHFLQSGHLLALELLVEPGTGIQSAQFVKTDISHQPDAVGGAAQVFVVKNHKFAGGTALHIKLDAVHP